MKWYTDTFFPIMRYLLGPFLLLISLLELLRSRRFDREALSAEGEIIGIKIKHHKGVWHLPVIRFRHMGQDYTFTSKFARIGGKRAYPVGGRIRIRFLADNPAQSAQIDSKAVLYERAYLPLIVGAIATWAAFALWT